MPDPTFSPPPTTLVGSLRYIGPGLILTAGIVGTGELVVTPTLAAHHGFTLLWLIIIGCLVKVFVQVEFGRYAVATGTPTLQMMDLVPGPRCKVGWMVWVFLPVYIATCSVLGGTIGGIAQILAMAGLTLSENITALLLGLSLAALLGIGRYRLIERFCVGLVIVFTISTIFAVVALQQTGLHITGANIAEGLRFQLPANFGVAFAALGLIGVGAIELIYYPYWCLEKGYATRIGPRDQEGWLKRMQGWLRVMKLDAFVSLVVYTSATIAFFLLGAAVLHGQNLEVDDQNMVPTLANMYLDSFGSAGFLVFLVGAFATLYSTAFAASAANARLLANLLPMLGVMKPETDGESHDRRVKWLGIALPLYGVAIFYIWPKPLTLMLINGIGQALLLPFLGITALYLRHRKLPLELRPGATWTTCLWISAAALTAAGLWQLWDRIN